MPRHESLSSRSPDRRTFLQRIGSGAALALLWPESLAALSAALPRSGGGPGDERFWQLVRAHFLIPADRLYLNIGTLGPQPRVVVDAVMEHTERVAMTFPPAIDWDALKARIGRLLNGDPAGFVFTRNTTEAMNFVANGLDLSAGDEVLTTDHEHIGGLCCWQLLAKRRGVGLRQLRLPVPPGSAEEVIDLFRKSIGPRTRVVSISHLTFTTGLVMPVREIVRLCRERGIVSVVDGAHPPGLMPVDLRALDADFYASSPHKWLMAAQGSGFLYMRDAWRTRLWPTIASGDWDDLSLGAHRLNHVGTIDESRLAALDAALRFHETIGPERVHARAAALRDRLEAGLREIRGLRIVSPPHPLVAGMVSFEVDGLESLELQKRLAAKNVRTRVIGEYDYGFMRLSPHVYNPVEEIDRVCRLIGEEAGRRG